MMRFLPAKYSHTGPMAAGMRARLVLPSDALVGRSELRVLPDRPKDPVVLRSLHVGDRIMLTGEVPVRWLTAFLVDNVRPGFQVVADFEVRAPMGHEITMIWLVKLHPIGPFGDAGPDVEPAIQFLVEGVP